MLPTISACSATNCLISYLVEMGSRLPRAAAKTPHEQTVLQGQIARADRHIDPLVYELYGLSADEIKIVEAGTA